MKNTPNSIPWNSLLSRVGCTTYAEYLKSPAWQEFRAHYLSREENRKCKVCGRTRVEVHHKTYHRLGKEQFGDVVSLCRDHHSSLHTAQKASRRGLKRFSREFIQRVRSGITRDARLDRAGATKPLPA